MSSVICHVSCTRAEAPNISLLTPCYALLTPPKSENLRTKLNVDMRDKGMKKLHRASQALEMNLSTIGNDERRTRTGYRTQQKREAFEKLERLTNSLMLNGAVLEQAKVIPNPRPHPHNTVPLNAHYRHR